MAVIVTHQDFKSSDDLMELYVVKRWITMTEEGNKDYIFDALAIEAQEGALEAVGEAEAECAPQVVRTWPAKWENDC